MTDGVGEVNTYATSLAGGKLPADFALPDPTTWHPVPDDEEIRMLVVDAVIGADSAVDLGARVSDYLARDSRGPVVKVDVQEFEKGFVATLWYDPAIQ